MLRVLEAARKLVPIEISSTFCGAHAVPRGGDVETATEDVITNQLTRVMELFHQQGWRVVASADVSAKYFKSKDREYPLDNHSWFLLHDPNTRTE